MRKIWIYNFLFLIMFLFSSCGEKIESVWKSQAIEVNGDGKDWEGFPLQFNEDMKVVYGVANDEHTLNFMIRFSDKNLARMFAGRGFTLWISNTDDEEKFLGIHYRDEHIRDFFMRSMRKPNRQSDRDDRYQALSIEPKGKFTFAKNDSITEIPLDDIFGFEASVGYSDGLYCYEFSVPIAQTDKTPHYLDISNTESILIGLEISSMSEEDKKKLKEEMANKRGSGMRGGGRGGRIGGRGSGGMRGGGMRSRGPQMPDMDGEEYWITVKLATK